MTAERLTPARLEWRVATVREVREETPRARTLLLDVPGWPGHLAGQHVDVRLVAEDGYEAQRSYSIASAPGDPYVALTIEWLENAEVSPYLCEVLQPGDGVEVRGPIGGWFVWDASLGGPLFLVAGGSGIVPLMSMLRHHSNVIPRSDSSPVIPRSDSPPVIPRSDSSPVIPRSDSDEGSAHTAPTLVTSAPKVDPSSASPPRDDKGASPPRDDKGAAPPPNDRRVRLLYSARTWDDVIYREELQRLAERPDVDVTFTLTREAPAEWKGFRRRIDREMLEEVGWPATDSPRIYVCGPTPLVERVASLLVELGHDPARVRTERFGPTG